MDIFKSFCDDDRGATAMEYGFIASLISMAIVAGAQLMGTGVGDILTTAQTALSPA